MMSLILGTFVAFANTVVIKGKIVSVHRPTTLKNEQIWFPLITVELTGISVKVNMKERSLVSRCQYYLGGER